MLRILIPEDELWDEAKQEFVPIKEQILELEHSLVSISKWEAKWHKPYLETQDKTPEESIDYIRCMTLTENVNHDVYYHLTRDNLDEISKYIKNPMTAAWFSEHNKSNRKSREKITNEIIYWQMISLGIPFECQYWHLNKLMTLIKVCNIKNQSGKKMSKKEVMERNRALNKARKKQWNTKG